MGGGARSFPQLMLRVIHLVSTCDFQAITLATSETTPSTNQNAAICTAVTTFPALINSSSVPTTPTSSTNTDAAEEGQIVKSVLVCATGVLTCALLSDVTEFASSINLPALIESASALLQGCVFFVFFNKCFDIVMCEESIELV